MACGVGSGSMMTAAAGTLGEIYPQQAENIMIMGGASDMLTGITGIYMGTFVGLPLTKNCMQYWNLKSVTKTVRRLNNGQKYFLQQLGLLLMVSVIMVLTNILGYKMPVGDSIAGILVLCAIALLDLQ